MSARYTDIALACVIAWMCWGLLSLFMGGLPALVAGALMGGGAATFLRHNMVVRGIMALFDPIGIVLPLLIVGQALRTLGLPLPEFAALELVLFLILYVAFLATVFGVVPSDPYRYGYHPKPVAVVVLLLCAYGVLTGNWMVPLIAVAGQAMWVFKIGSSNYFDHILHATLVPVALVTLIARMIW